MTLSEWKKNVGNNIRLQLMYKGMSRKELSEKSGVDISDISKLIRGKKMPGTIMMNNIAMALGVSIGSLVDFWCRIEPDYVMRGGDDDE